VKRLRIVKRRALVEMPNGKQRFFFPRNKELISETKALSQREVLILKSP